MPTGWKAKNRGKLMAARALEFTILTAREGLNKSSEM
jgi:hypothetical protein